MTTLAIEINDSELVVADRDQVLGVEPGYALVDKGEILTGAAAYRLARLKPRQVSNRYWAELSLEEGTAGIADVRSAAELAYAQLRSLWKRFGSAAKDVLLIVPGNYSGAQLGLLLGLAQECGMPVRAMLDVAAAASSRPYPGRQLVYVDAGLHRATVRALRQDHEATALDERGLESAGLAALNDLFAKRIAEIFVLATRFDPLHRADSEQALYDRLPGWLQRLQSEAKVELALPFGEEELTVDLERSQLLAAAGGFYKALLQLIAQTREPGAALVVQLSERVARQPGLQNELARLDDAVVVAHEAGHAARAALLGLDGIDAGADQVKLLRRVAWRADPHDAPALRPLARTPAVASDRVSAPTHIVYRGIAYPIDGDGVLIGRSATENRRVIVIDDQNSGVSRSHCELVLINGELVLRDLSSYGTFVNERRVSGEEILRLADVIRIGSPGTELQLVRVEQAHGA
jgi:hypothetical protein